MESALPPARDFTAFRLKAEKKFEEQVKRLTDLSTHEVHGFIRELGTQHVELEVQNVKLRMAQEELEALRRKYEELYDFAPVGYFTFDTHGVIQEVNLAGADLLGIEKSLLINKSFVSYIADPEDIDIFYAHCKEIVRTQTQHACEIRLKRKNSPAFYALLHCRAVNTLDDKTGHVRAALIDITARKQLEEEREKLILDWQEALSKVKTLTGLLPICSWCKKVHNDDGYWQQVEGYISEHADVLFSHGICPECHKKASEDYENYKKKK